MAQEDKDLLFKDISARLPYHVHVKVWLKDGTTEEGVLNLEHNYSDVLRDAFYYKEIIDIKPYLRPMSSMTEEEEKEYRKTMDKYISNSDDFSKYTEYSWTIDTFDFLNAHHLDYRGLIPMGLAIEAPKGMYKL